jgi:hypothetical protein
MGRGRNMQKKWKKFKTFWWVILKVVVHLGDLGIEGSVVGWMLKQWTIRTLVAVKLFSIESSVGLLWGIERKGSVRIVAGLQLDWGNVLQLTAQARDVSSSRRPGWIRGPPSHQGLFPQRYCSRCLNLTKQYHSVVGTRWRSWLRQCAANRKVVGSIFRWLNPSGCTMVLGSTEPVTEMTI